MRGRQNDEPEVTCAELGSLVASQIETLESGLQILRDCVKDLERAGNDLLARGDDAHTLGPGAREEIMDHIIDVFHSMVDAEVELKAIRLALDE